MRIDDVVLSCVGFLGVPKDGGSIRYAGTAFLIAIDDSRLEGGGGFTYLVTAKHNIENATREHGVLVLRVNLKNGGSRPYEIPTGGWLYPDNDASDVAVLPFANSGDYDHLPVASALFATPDTIVRYGVGIGSDLAIAGLFNRRQGEERNLPVLRSGIISAMPSENLTDQHRGTSYPAYLAEIRSFGGLSGSPVFARGEPIEAEPNPPFLLIGLVTGHWDYENSGTIFELDESHAINMGMGIVTPISEVLDAIDQEHENRRRRDAVEEYNAQRRGRI